MQWHGPTLVSFGAFLWATDALFRSQLTHHFKPLFIVSVTHCLCLLVTLPLRIFHRHAPKEINACEWLALAFLAGGGSIVAMVAFTMAFSQTNNFNIPILLQKLQPVVAISLASLILKERVNRLFLICSVCAIFGGYLISFGDLSAWSNLQGARGTAVICTLLAATIWGTCTVASRFVLKRHSYIVVMTLRYTLATLALIILNLFMGHWQYVSQLTVADMKNFFLMAYLPGFIALFIYYQGLEETNASTATICELAFPLGAIFINWIFLDSPLNALQIVGAGVLTIAVTIINLTHKNQRHAPQ